MNDEFVVAFIGYTTDDLSDAAIQYEDGVTPILAEHGARLLYRGRRVERLDQDFPLEVHLIWFPTRSSFEDYLADKRRIDLQNQLGQVFTATTVVELDTISVEPDWPGTPE